MYQVGAISVKEMMNKKKYPNLAKYSKVTLFRHALKPVDEVTHDKHHQNRSPPIQHRMMSERSEDRFWFVANKPADRMLHGQEYVKLNFP